jgi:hypothetical protein
MSSKISIINKKLPLIHIITIIMTIIITTITTSYKEKKVIRKNHMLVINLIIYHLCKTY